MLEKLKNWWQSLGQRPRLDVLDVISEPEPELAGVDAGSQQHKA